MVTQGWRRGRALLLLQQTRGVPALRELTDKAARTVSGRAHPDAQPCGRRLSAATPEGATWVGWTGV